MVFDSKGGFYFTDFRGYSTNPLGGVYYVSPDFRTVTPAIIQNISVANGIALSTDEKVLWVTETTANRLHRIALEDDGVTIQPLELCSRTILQVMKDQTHVVLIVTIIYT